MRPVERTPAGRAAAAHVLALALAGSACAPGVGGAPGGTAATPERGPAPSSSVPGAFERDLSPFPVLDEHGREYAMPFLGGLVAPRPQFVDVDGDGDPDLFVQEYSSDLWFFENVGSASEPRFEWRTDRYQDLDVGEWYRFVDIDGDGLVDLLAEEAFSYIRHYRNVGSPGAPRFERADSLRDTSGRAIFLDRQNIPALVDLDCNDRLDLFAGRVEGTVARYEAERPGSDRFVFLTEFWEGIEIVGQFESNGSARHGANALAFADFDGDGRLDLFWGDFFEPGVLLIANVGRTCSSPSFRVEPVLLPGADSIRTSGYNAPAPVDLNGNGMLDFLMGVLGGAYNPVATSADNFYHWERVAPDRFELATRRFLDGIDVGSESIPALVDLDGSGTLDLVIGSKVDPLSGDAGRLFVFANEGTATAPRFRLSDTLLLADAYHQAPAFADLDGDGTLDLLLGTWGGEILYFRGEAGAAGVVPGFVPDTARTLRLPRGGNATPALVDIDGDGDLDLFVGQANGGVAFYRNEGSRGEPHFVLVTERLDGVAVGRRSAPTFLDVDGDGRPDLVIGREEGGLAVFRNVGGPEEPRFAEHDVLSTPLPPMSSPAFADLDGDGVLDLVSGSASGGVVFYRGSRAP